MSAAAINPQIARVALFSHRRSSSTSDMSFEPRLKQKLPRRNTISSTPYIPLDIEMEEEPVVKSILKKPGKQSEVLAPKQMRFNPVVTVGETHHREVYERKSDYMLHLTPELAYMIKKELNEFKTTEMAVHESSRIYTHLFKM